MPARVPTSCDEALAHVRPRLNLVVRLVEELTGGESAARLDVSRDACPTLLARSPASLNRAVEEPREAKQSYANPKTRASPRGPPSVAARCNFFFVSRPTAARKYWS